MSRYYYNLIASMVRGEAVPSNPLWNDLLAYYTADNTPNDALGTYNGTLTNGATYGTGKINQGFSLDGVNDYVNFGNVLDFDGSTPFSISCWTYSTNINSLKFIIGKAFAGVPYTGYGMFFYQNKIRCFIQQVEGTDSLYKTGSVNLSVNTWYHITMTYDGSKTVAGLKVYVDGSVYSMIDNYDNFTGSSSNSKNFTIGVKENTWYYSGIQDEVGIWNRELTASEVTQLYNSGAGLQYT